VTDRLKVYHTRHEQAAAYMAVGASMSTGEPQAFAVVPGPGLLNASAALLTAEGVCAPVLGLVGQIPQADIDRNRGQLHEVRDQLGLSRHITKFTKRIRAPYEAPAIIHDALVEMLSDRPGPAVVECAMDVWARRGPVEICQKRATRRIAPVDFDAVATAAAALAAAKNPMIVVGAGAIDAGVQIASLAELLQAPILSYRRGRGVVSSEHPLSINLPIGHRLWPKVDVVLAIGSRMLMQETQWGVDRELQILRIDADPEGPDRYDRTTVAMRGDATDYTAALLDTLPRHLSRRPAVVEELARQQAWFADRMTRLEPQASFLRAIRAALPSDGIFVDEVTQLGFASRVAFPVYAPRTFLSPGYQDNLGWGYGAALGAKAANPDKVVLCIAGDGGFMYQVGELATAVNHNLAVIVVVFDNSMYGNVKRIQEAHYGGRVIAAELASPDFCKLAESFGLAGFTARTAPELERAIDAAIALNAPALIHVPCGEMPSVWDMLLMGRVRG
jgi:acetolactate synthase-1/2/3 large subunit